MLKLFNTYSNTIEEFKPINGNHVNMYVCGPTVYDHPHLGHARCYITWDVVYRYLKFLGYDVKYCRNVTDVDDKILNKSVKENCTPDEIAKKYYDIFTESMKKLNNLKPDVEPFATKTLGDMIKMVKTLIEKGYAYEADGDVYFRVKKFPRYGYLSKQPIDDLESGARVEASDIKEDPLDFALWKKDEKFGYKSPWVGIGAYSVATATGLMRIANNKHWLSDVLAGAGIGIITTEIGYLLADLIFKEKGINRFPEDGWSFERWEKPSFLSLYVGMNVPLSGYDLDEGHEFSTSSGSTAGMEGAWFFNPYMGVGGRFTASNTSIIVDDKEAEANTFDALSLCAGGYFSYPLSSRFLIGGKLLGGYVHYPQLQLSDETIPRRDGICFGSGVSLTFRATRHYGMKLFLDYNLMPSHSWRSGEWMNTMTAGSAFMILF